MWSGGRVKGGVGREGGREGEKGREGKGREGRERFGTARLYRHAIEL